MGTHATVPCSELMKMHQVRYVSRIAELRLIWKQFLP